MVPFCSQLPAPCFSLPAPTPPSGYNGSRMNRIDCFELSNGLALLVEPMEGVASTGLTWLLPAGVVKEPEDRQGIGAVLEEMIFRGAGDRDARAHADALDLLGVHRSAEAMSHHFRLGATFLGDRIADVLPLIVDMVRRPHLREEDFQPSVELSLHEIEALEDEPQEKVMVELKRQHMGPVLGRSNLGQAEHLRAMSVGQVRGFVARHFVAGGSILALAGAVKPMQVRELAQRLLGDMGGRSEPVEDAVCPPDGRRHIVSRTAQQHIGLAYETIAETDPQRMAQRLAVAVLSGGMSGRLFTEVREKRGLCYSVYATYVGRRKSGTVFAYSGTTPQRAAQTLEVLTGELQRLSGGIKEEEFQRAVVGFKSKLVMQGESTSARARAIAFDRFLLGRARTLDEVAAEIDAVTLDPLNRFVSDHKPGGFTTLTIGPEELKKEPSRFA